MLLALFYHDSQRPYKWWMSPPKDVGVDLPQPCFLWHFSIVLCIENIPSNSFTSSNLIFIFSCLQRSDGPLCVDLFLNS